MPPHPASSTAFTAVADPTRRAILDALGEGELAAGELHDAAGRGMSQPSFSKHLSVLRDAGLVRARQEGRYRLYRAEPAPLREIVAWAADWVETYDRYWDGALGRLESHLDRKHGAKPRKRSSKEGAA